MKMSELASGKKMTPNNQTPMADKRAEPKSSPLKEQPSTKESKFRNMKIVSYLD